MLGILVAWLGQKSRDPSHISSFETGAWASSVQAGSTAGFASWPVRCSPPILPNLQLPPMETWWKLEEEWKYSRKDWESKWPSPSHPEPGPGTSHTCDRGTSSSVAPRFLLYYQQVFFPLPVQHRLPKTSISIWEPWVLIRSNLPGVFTSWFLDLRGSPRAYLI